MLPVAVRVRAREEFALNLEEDRTLYQESNYHAPQEVFALVNWVAAHPEPEEHASRTDKELDENAKIPFTSLDHVAEIDDEEYHLSANKESDQKNTARYVAAAAAYVLTTTNSFS